MPGMSLLSFLIVTLIGAIVAVVYQNVIRYPFLEGQDALIGKLIIGWFGAWLGSPVLGHWFWKVESVYIVPAILGAMAAIHLTVLAMKALARLAAMRPEVAQAKKEELCPGRAAAA